jgi:hypothetical protein
MLVFSSPDPAAYGLTRLRVDDHGGDVQVFPAVGVGQPLY